MSWHAFGAAVIGSGHLDAGLPCQDAFARADAGDVFCAAVCDGAGSASASDHGARLVSSRVVESLSQCLGHEAGAMALSVDALRGELVRIIEGARDELRAHGLASGRKLADYAATLVGVLAAPSGGWLFHCGDGVGVARVRGDVGAVEDQHHGRMIDLAMDLGEQIAGLADEIGFYFEAEGQITAMAELSDLPQLVDGLRQVIGGGVGDQVDHRRPYKNERPL